MQVEQGLKIAAAALRNVALGGNLLSLSLLTRPRRLVVYANQCVFLYRKFRVRQEIPLKNVFEVLCSTENATITLTDLTSTTWFDIIPSAGIDLMSLCLICQILKPAVVFEIGTLLGHSAHHFAMNTPPDATIYTLDLPPGTSSGLKYKTTAVDDQRIREHVAEDNAPGIAVRNDVESKIRFLYGDSATFDYAPFQGKVDFFFIDGAHAYEYVRSDTLNALTCCHPGSVIAWHDYGRSGVNGVTRWLNSLRRAGYDVYNVPGGSLAFMRVP